MNRLYALLVGIDEYKIPRPLRGCVADIREYETFLRERVDHKSYRLDLHTLLNSEATHGAVTGGIRAHLGQAAPGDAALFVFCGHGSQQRSSHWKIEPDLMDETLVCYDSRIGGLDLTDKELAHELGEVSARGAHVAVILDSCHSGSGTRNVNGQDEEGVREAPPREDFDPAGYPRELFPRVAAGSGWTIPGKGRHILLAACASHERAKECVIGAQYRGVFSSSLLEALKSTQGRIAYSSLFEGAVAGVRARIFHQNPQLEAIDPADLDLPFLGGVLTARPRLLSVSHHAGLGWMLNLGAMHGITASIDPVRLLLYQRGSSPDRVRCPGNAAGRAVVTRVLATASTVTLDFTPNHSEAGFEAYVEWAPVPASAVALAGDDEGLRELRGAMRVSGPGAGPSPFIEEGPRGSAILVRATPAVFAIHINGEETEPLTEVSRTGFAAAASLVEQLEHIVCWQQIRAFPGNESSGIADDEVEVSLLQDEMPLRLTDLHLEYHEKEGKLQKPGFTIRLHNKGPRRLWFSLLALTESFAIVPLLAEQSAVLEPHQTLFARDGETLRTSLPQRLLDRGRTETLDILRVLISTASFDGRLLKQPPLQQARSRSAGLRAPFARTHLNLILNRLQTRDIDPADREESVDDWRSIDIHIRTVRSHPWENLTPEGLSLPAGVRLTCPPLLAAQARLNSETARSCLLRNRQTFDGGATIAAPFLFLQPFGNDPGLGVLEFVSISGSEFVTPDNPIRVSVAPLQSGEYILPFAFRGSAHVPLGRSETANGATSILIERLPDPEPGGVSRILFQRLDRAPATCD